MRHFLWSGCLLASGMFSLLAAAGDAGFAEQGSTFRDCSYCPEMIVLPAGSFVMGSIASENGHNDEEGPLRLVKFARMFAMSRTEITQVQWAALMRDNPSHFQDCGAQCPVERVSWHDTQDYLVRLNAKTGKRYRLPSEAEWEYACRAGGAQTYCGGEDIGELAWLRSNSGGTPHPAAAKRANAWGLYDMNGNVFEWVADCWNGNYQNAPTDGGAWLAGDCSRRVLRGGAWFVEPPLVRAAARLKLTADDRNGAAGFRVVRPLP